MPVGRPLQLDGRRHRAFDELLGGEFAQDAVGLWADVGRLTVPRSDHPATGLSRPGPVAPEHYHVQAGTVRVGSDGG